ncbi:MAG: glycosyltransferase family 2 protein [Muribaculaceae bacterium]
MALPLLSIIVSVFNIEHYLPRCIDSIVNQTCNDIEVILVDDGSTDDSGIICDRYSAMYNYIKVIHKSNGGLTSARYAGYKSSSGKYIWFVDGDDFIEKGACEKLISYITKNKFQLLVCAYNRYQDQQKYSIHNTNIINDNFNVSDYVKALIGPSTTHPYISSFLWRRMFRKDLISDDCFANEEEVFAEDLVFNLQYAKKITHVDFCEYCTYNYSYNDNSLSNKYRPNMWNMRKNLYLYCKQYASDNHIECDYELFNILSTAVLSSIQNYSRLKYSDFRDVFNVMRADIVFHEFKSEKFTSKRFTGNIVNFRLLHLIINIAPTFFIYKLYNWRHKG